MTPRPPCPAPVKIRDPQILARVVDLMDEFDRTQVDPKSEGSGRRSAKRKVP